MRKGPLRRRAKKDGDVKSPLREPEKGRTKVRRLHKRRTESPVFPVGTGTQKTRKTGHYKSGVAHRRGNTVRRACVARSRFVSWFAVGEGEGVFDDLGDAAVAGFGSTVIEDGEQVAAAARRGHTLPSCE